MTRHLVSLCLTALLLLPFASPVCADTIAVKSADLRVEEDEYVLNADFDFALNATLEEALQRGVSLYFILEFELTRPRWYWVDEKVAQVTTQYRVTFNPLTRQYRVTSGLLSQLLDSQEEVERLIARVLARPIIRKEALARGSRYEAALRLRLDVAQLPKPFQINALTSADWSLQSPWYRWTVTP